MDKIVKLSTPWDHDFLKRTPKGEGVFGSYKFEINNSCRECDYWIVWGGVREIEKTKCPRQNIIYVTDETHSERRFDSNFLNQFETVIACRKDIQHRHIIPTHDLGIWHFNKSYDEVEALNIQIKTKRISVVSSDLTFLPGHKNRFAYVNKMIGHFEDRVDYYGRGINPIEDKFLGIADYKYSVAIENSFVEGYFTEKIFECFLTNTFPIYYGCPDLEKYFDDRSFARIDISDYKTAFRITEELLSRDQYSEHVPFLQEAKKIYLNKYYFFPAVINIIEQSSFLKENKKKSGCEIFPESYFHLDPLHRVVHRLRNYS